MTTPVPSQADIQEAVAVASRHGRAVDAHTPGIEQLATALSALRRDAEGQTTPNEDLLAAHDLLYDSPLAHHDGGCMRKLAEALLARGVVPAPRDYNGKWWLWWPKKGHGPCRDCHQHRALTRFSARWGKQYRYLCARCRTTERSHDAELAKQPVTTTVTSVHAQTAPLRRQESLTESTHGWRAQPERAETGSRLAPPPDNDWDRYVRRLDELLVSLEWAGFEMPESWDSDWDPEVGAVLFSDIWRGDAALVVEYRPQQNQLALQPFDDVMGDAPESFSLLDETVKIPVAATDRAGQTAVERTAGKLALLDATRVRVADTAPEHAKQEFSIRRIRRMFQPAAHFRNIPLTEVLREVTENEWLSAYLEMVVDMAGHSVAPDVVPDAAALGVAAWCWRNNTAVEAHHLETDVLMARVNVAVTRIAREHTCPYDGIDWDSIQTDLMNPQWALPDGTTIHSLFNDAWPEVASTVTRELQRWARIDRELLGPRSTLILMTIGGSTSYTQHWWGQGRWRSICQHIAQDAAQGGISLPPPYNDRGASALLDDLADPDQVSDNIWDWLIDMPEADIDGPRGLRFHHATQPVTHRWDPYWLAEPAAEAATE